MAQAGITSYTRRNSLGQVFGHGFNSRHLHHLQESRTPAKDMYVDNSILNLQLYHKFSIFLLDFCQQKKDNSMLNLYLYDRSQHKRRHFGKTKKHSISRHQIRCRDRVFNGANKKDLRRGHKNSIDQNSSSSTPSSKLNSPNSSYLPCRYADFSNQSSTILKLHK